MKSVLRETPNISGKPKNHPILALLEVTPHKLEYFSLLWRVLFSQDKHKEGSEFSSYEMELCKMKSHFELLTRNFLIEIIFSGYWLNFVKY